MTFENLAEVAVPKATATYTPVSHVDLINCIRQELDKAKLIIKDERFNVNRAGQQLFGNITVTAEHAEQDMNIGFRNSYDKTLQLGLVTGSRVIVCSNLMFSGEYKTLHMHKGEIAAELEGVVAKAVGTMESNFKRILKETDKMKAKKIDKAVIHELIGALYLEENLLTNTQLSLIKDELAAKTLFSDETIWDIYNHTTEVLKKSPVAKVVENHLNAHKFFMARI